MVWFLEKISKPKPKPIQAVYKSAIWFQLSSKWFERLIRCEWGYGGRNPCGGVGTKQPVEEKCWGCQTCSGWPGMHLWHRDMLDAVNTMDCINNYHTVWVEYHELVEWHPSDGQGCWSYPISNFSSTSINLNSLSPSLQSIIIPNPTVVINNKHFINQPKTM